MKEYTPKPNEIFLNIDRYFTFAEFIHKLNKSDTTTDTVVFEVTDRTRQFDGENQKLIKIGKKVSDIAMITEILDGFNEYELEVSSNMQDE